MKATAYGQFPIRYEDDKLLVFTNDSGGVFIHNKRDPNSEIRVGSYGDVLAITAHNGQLIPWAINGLSAILVRGKK